MKQYYEVHLPVNEEQFLNDGKNVRDAILDVTDAFQDINGLYLPSDYVLTANTKLMTWLNDNNVLATSPTDIYQLKGL